MTIAVLTGAGGFIGTHIAKALLESGYTVRATVRDAKNETKAAHLKALAAALPGTLELYSADLLAAGAFDEVVSGADYVFHSASPVILQSDNPQQDVVDPAVKGTVNLLSSVAKTGKSVKRVVLTSSVAAMTPLSMAKTLTPPKNGEAYDEADWNDDSDLDHPYALSKALAEKAAWDEVKKSGIDMVVINPVYVLGPVIGDVNAGAGIVRAMLGLLMAPEPTMLNGTANPIVDVRDVALAHLRAAELPSASGRHLLAATKAAATPKQVVSIMREHFPGVVVADGPPTKLSTPLDNTKAIKELGISFRPLEETLVDMARSLIIAGHVSPKFDDSKAPVANGGTAVAA